MKKWLLVACLAALSACGSGMDGTYADQMGITRYTFKSGGKVVMNAMGTEMELDYEREDDKVKLSTPQGTLLLTVLDNGDLQGPMGMKLVRQE